MWLIASNREDVQSLLHLHQLLVQSMQRHRSRRVCMCVCVHVAGWMENCIRQVFCTPVQTSIYTVTGVVDNIVYTCDHTQHGVYICTRACAFCLFVLSNLSTTCVCITGVF